MSDFTLYELVCFHVHFQSENTLTNRAVSPTITVYGKHWIKVFWNSKLDAEKHQIITQFLAYEITLMS